MFKMDNKKNAKTVRDYCKSLLFLVLVCCSLLIVFSVFSTDVSATGISVTKAVMDFNDVLKGGYAEDVLYVSTDAPFNVPISYELLGDIASWINVSPDLNNPNITYNINNSNYLPVRIIVSPPADTPIGTYTGTVRIITGTLNKPGGQYGSQLQAAFMVRITIKVTGTEFLSCSGGGMTIRNSEVGNPMEYFMTVSNGGNIRIKPTATIDIWNQDQTKLLMTRKLEFNNQEVLPTTTQAFASSFTSDLRVGQYWAYATIEPCGSTGLMTFNVYEKGTIVDSGDLIRIDNIAWAKVGDVVPITAVFKNSGQRTVSAKFKGIITSNSRIIENIDSDFYDIAPGQTGNIQVFFTPKKYGQYIITGRILYNNKLSFEKSSVLNVNEGVEVSDFNWTYVLIIIVIVIIILLLLIRIRKKRHSMRRL
jgi:hypothetical protein